MRQRVRDRSGVRRRQVHELSSSGRLHDVPLHERVRDAVRSDLHVLQADRLRKTDLRRRDQLPALTIHAILTMCSFDPAQSQSRSRRC